MFMECEAGRLHQVTTTCHVDFLPFSPEHGGPDVGAFGHHLWQPLALPGTLRYR